MKLLGISRLGLGYRWSLLARGALGVLGMAVLGLLIHSCGTQGDDNKAEGVSQISASSLVADPQLTSSVVNAAHGDAVAAAADQSGSGASLQLALADGDNDGSSVTKSCTTSGNSAVVSVSSIINRSRTKSSGGGRVTVTAARTGTGSSTRTWSKTDGTAVACRSDKGAAIDFKNPSGVKLEVSFERSRTDSMTYTGPKVTRTSSRSFSSSGKRTVTWSSNDTTGDASTYARNKSVVIKDVVQSLTMTNKDGQSVSSTLSINTAENAPLVVNVERNNTTNAVVNKTFVSGQVVVKKDSDATITTTYTNLKLNYADNSCSISDGTAQVVVTDSTGTTLKTYTLGKSTDGDDGSLKDSSSGSEVDGFALDPCDSEDVKL